MARAKKHLLRTKKSYSIGQTFGYFLHRLNGLFFKHCFCGVGRDFRVSGKPKIHGSGKISAGDSFSIVSHIYPVEIFADENAEVNIGNNVFVNEGAIISAQERIDIGDLTIIGGSVLIMDSDYHGIDGKATKTAPIKIGRQVWLCSRAIVLKGVTIGDNSVVAAGSVVARDVPPNTIVAGNPAKVVRSTTGYTLETDLNR